MHEQRIGPGRLADVECGGRPRADGVVVVHGDVYDPNYGRGTRDEHGHARVVAVAVHGHVGDVLARGVEAAA